MLCLTNLSAATEFVYYRSNVNGLKLIKINQNQMRNFRFVLRETIDGTLVQNRLLYRDGVIYKRWLYYYNADKLSKSSFYDESGLVNESFYNESGHLIKFREYLNGDVIKVTDYRYNQNGLVEFESLFNAVSNQTTTTRYRYDTNFRIKQMERLMPDGRTIYWDVIFSDKGIVSREYYTLENEAFTFFYNENGLELNGEVREIVDGVAGNVKIEWTNTYTEDGYRITRNETNFVLKRKTLTTYNRSGQEVRIETETDSGQRKLETYTYNSDDKVETYTIVEGLNIKRIVYYYNNTDLSMERHYIQNVLEKEVVFLQDNRKRITSFTTSGRRVITEYNNQGEIESQIIR